MALADPADARPRPRPWPERVLTVGAPVVYLVALGVTTRLDGLPLARDQLFFWLVLGMAAFSVAAWRSWGMMLLEWLPLLALLVAYDFLRGAVSVPDLQAYVHPQIRFDEWLGGGAVPTVWLQQHLWDPVRLHWYDYACWAVYMSHFFVVWVVAAVLWRVAHHRFRPYVALTVLVTVAALATYWLFPAQPPWLAAEHGLLGPVVRVVPTVWGALGVPTASSLWENGDLVNLVAAMPSLHACYPFMLLLFFWPVGWRARIPLAAYTLAMGFALVYGGEHWVLDILVGWLWTVLAFALVAWVWPRVRRSLPTRRARARA